MDNIVTFPGSSEREPTVAKPEPTGEKRYGSSRSRAAVQLDIDAHVKARRAYGKAVAWEAAAQAEELPAYRIEEARCLTAMAYREMQEAARHLLICMPTDPKGLVDLLMYLEKNFSVLPQEISQGAGANQSLAFDLLRTPIMKRRRRSVSKRNRQRIAGHARRLRR
jgi:hypothetical protein